MGLRGFQRGNKYGKLANHKGQIAWNKGKKLKPLSKEQKRKLSDIHKRIGSRPPSNKGIPHSEETKRKISKSHKGMKHSLKTRRKISQVQMGRIPWNKHKPNPWAKGARSNFWKGGVTALAEAIRGLYKYRQWRSDVFTRDNFTCQDCFIRGTMIQAHHIEAFTKILSEYQIKTIEQALSCEKLWDINNGQTLCKRCHKRTDNYGYIKV